MNKFNSAEGYIIFFLYVVFPKGKILQATHLMPISFEEKSVKFAMKL